MDLAGNAGFAARFFYRFSIDLPRIIIGRNTHLLCAYKVRSVQRLKLYVGLVLRYLAARGCTGRSAHRFGHSRMTGLQPNKLGDAKPGICPGCLPLARKGSRLPAHCLIATLGPIPAPLVLNSSLQRRDPPENYSALLISLLIAKVLGYHKWHAGLLTQGAAVTCVFIGVCAALSA
jgi:hypothetical protein